MHVMAAMMHPTCDNHRVERCSAARPEPKRDRRVGRGEDDVACVPYLRAVLLAVYGISVEGVIDRSVLDACRGSERIAGYRRIRLSTFGRLRGGGFALLATFDHPHFTVVLADLSDVTVARFARAFDLQSLLDDATHAANVG